MIPGFEIVNPDAAPIKRVVVDVHPHEIAAINPPPVPADTDATLWRNFYVTWVVAEKLRKAGIPVTPLTGQLMRGTMTWFDLCDSGARRFVWEEL